MVSAIGSEEATRLQALVRQAGSELLRHWPGTQRGTRELQITKKQDGSFVTEADMASNQILVHGLQTLFPEDGIFSEEMPLDDRSRRSEAVWIIDPLDGTQSFIDGNDDFSILVARCVEGRPVFSMMYFPVPNHLAITSPGCGALLNGTPMKVSTSPIPRAGAIYLRHLKLPPQSIFYDRWMDSGQAFLNVARGVFDGVILKIVNHQEWDLAAPMMAMQESGAQISDEQGNQVRFGLGPVKFKYFVASNGLVHQQLLGLIPS